MIAHEVPCINSMGNDNLRGTVHTFAARAIHLDTSSPLLPILVVIMPNLQRSMKVTRSSTFSFNEVSSLFLAVYGSAVLSPVSVLLNLSDMIDDEVVNVRKYGCLCFRIERCEFEVLMSLEVSNGYLCNVRVLVNPMRSDVLFP